MCAKKIEIQFYDDWNMVHKVTCPHCSKGLDLYHMDWSAILCEFCNKEIRQ